MASTIATKDKASAKMEAHVCEDPHCPYFLRQYDVTHLLTSPEEEPCSELKSPSPLFLSPPLFASPINTMDDLNEQHDRSDLNTPPTSPTSPLPTPNQSDPPTSPLLTSTSRFPTPTIRIHPWGFEFNLTSEDELFEVPKRSFSLPITTASYLERAEDDNKMDYSGRVGPQSDYLRTRNYTKKARFGLGIDSFDQVWCYTRWN